MKIRFAFATGVLALLAGLLFAPAASAQELPPPSAGSVLATGLIQPKGMTLGPDGMLYVAESGSGGDTDVTLPDGSTTKVGRTGRISKIDPATGARTTVADELPSNTGPQGDAVGPAAVAFIGSTLYYLQTHSGEAYGFPDDPTGIYRVNSDGSTALIADIGAFNKANPVKAITDGVQHDVEPGGNPYAMTVRSGVFYVVDGNHNRLMKVTTDGDVSEITEFPNHPVSTGIAENPSGPFYVAYLGQAPFLPDAGKVVSVGATTGTITEIASGASMLTDVAVGPAGQLYALQFNDPQLAGEAFFAPGTGSVLKVNADGTFSPIITGLSFATDMLFSGNTLYIANGGITPIGSIVRVENFTSVQPPAATPTAAPTQAPAATPTRPTGVTAPETGTGGYAGGEGGSPTWLVVALVAGVALSSAGGALALKRR